MRVILGPRWMFANRRRGNAYSKPRARSVRYGGLRGNHHPHDRRAGQGLRRQRLHVVCGQGRHSQPRHGRPAGPALRGTGSGRAAPEEAARSRTDCARSWRCITASRPGRSRLFVAYISASYTWTSDQGVIPLGRNTRIRRPCWSTPCVGGFERGEVRRDADLELFADTLVAAYVWNYRLACRDRADLAGDDLADGPPDRPAAGRRGWPNSRAYLGLDDLALPEVRPGLADFPRGGRAFGRAQPGL